MGYQPPYEYDPNNPNNPNSAPQYPPASQIYEPAPRYPSDQPGAGQPVGAYPPPPPPSPSQPLYPPPPGYA
ncbi:MAG TPA: hypothetical protein VE338_06150, partial [Ktedonobacterales bacterium]|nr:hypothetical protein [Ktedonobacterales bacterium]